MVLTQKMAEERFKVIKPNSIEYNFHLKLSDHFYEGYAELVFHLAQVPQALHIDFSQSKVKLLIVNSKTIADFKYDGTFLIIDKCQLNIARNEVFVLYQNSYQTDGNGCTKGTTKKKTHIFTQFESYHACKVFPLFDQPDLKAKMKLSLLTKEDWGLVVSNEVPILKTKIFDMQTYINTTKNINCLALEQLILDFSGNMTIFRQTKQISSYIFAFVVGNYMEMKFQNTHRDIPMSLYFPKQMKEQIDKVAPILNKVMNQSFCFFQQFFQCPYQFSKYDQIIVAGEFYDQGMQNLGCVTISRSLFQQFDIEEDLIDSVSTLIHQLCHHWFGNYVTMRWWNDLWLNESVTQFMTALCLKNIKHVFSSKQWQQEIDEYFLFDSPNRSWGRQIIRREAKDTKNLDQLFDSLIYDKGSAIIKQLYFYVGPECFQRSLASFINKYGMGNSNLEEFIEEFNKNLNQNTNLDLFQWSKVWLQSPSFNVIEPIYFNPEDKSPESKIIIQMKSFDKDSKVLRPHKIKIGLVRSVNKIDEIQVLLNARELNEVTYDGSKKCEAIILNYDNYSFIQTKLDAHSKAYLKNNLRKLKEPIRQQIEEIFQFQKIKNEENQILSIEYN